MKSTPMIEVQNVSLRMGSQWVLENVSFTVRPGEFLTILGPNGAGKTTLLRVILGLIRPQEGRVFVFGKLSWELSRQERTRIGYVPQGVPSHRHFPILVQDVVLMGRFGALGWGKRPTQQDRERVKQVLDLLGIRSLASRSFQELSGGQRQRVMIARALINHPDLLLLDEPTASLDPSMTEDFYTLLKRLQRDLRLTVVMVSHDIGMVATFADRVACLARRLVAHGRPEKVLSKETLECMYGFHTMAVGHGSFPHMILPLQDHHPPSPREDS